ncbi:Uncharacterised protein [Mycobacteroides abscessus subsp. abscessus]|nr:Uncharacterised protein [Mycobacteroides abscessus subsp. abscessus]
MNTRSGAGTTAVESVAMSGNSGRCCGYLGVMVATARTEGTPSTEPRCFFAKSALATMSAAAPSLVAQMSSSRSGSDTTGLASTSATEDSLRNLAFGLFRPCREFFTLTWAKSSTVAPKRSIRRRASRAKYTGLVAPMR